MKILTHKSKYIHLTTYFLKAKLDLYIFILIIHKTCKQQLAPNENKQVY